MAEKFGETQWNRSRVCVGYRIDGVTQLQLELTGGQEEHFRSWPTEEVLEDAVQMVRLFDFASRHDVTRYTPLVVDVFDHVPTDEELWASIAAGRIGMCYSVGGELKAVAERFRKRHATFAELRAAVRSVAATPL